STRGLPSLHSQIPHQRLNHPVLVPVNLVIPEPDHRPSLALEKRRPRLIVSALLRRRVRRPIHLDNKLHRRADKVRIVRPDLLLPPELIPQQRPPLEARPEYHLRPSHSGPHPPRPIQRLPIHPRHRNPPPLKSYAKSSLAQSAGGGGARSATEGALSTSG